MITTRSLIDLFLLAAFFVWLLVFYSFSPWWTIFLTLPAVFFLASVNIAIFDPSRKEILDSLTMFLLVSLVSFIWIATAFWPAWVLLTGFVIIIIVGIAIRSPSFSEEARDQKVQSGQKEVGL